VSFVKFKEGLSMKIDKIEKIVLFFPPGWESIMPPQGISYLKSFLMERGYDVKCIDFGIELGGRFFNGSGKKLDASTKKILSFKPDVVGFTTLQPKLRQIRNTLSIVEKVKRKSPNTKIIAGGPHIAYVGNQILQFDFIDFAIRGEGELGLLKLLNSSRLRSSLTKSRTVFESPAIENLNELPFPNFDDFDLDKYPLKLLPLNTTRGCKMNCTFCGLRTNKIHGPYRERTPAKIVEEIKQDINKYGINRFGITDELVNINPRYIRKICEAISENKLEIKWLAEAFPHISSADLGKMYDSGCRLLYLCPETGSPKTAQQMRKGIDLKIVEKTLMNAAKKGIGVSAWFIVGFPGETMDDIKLTEKFAEKIQKYCLELIFVPFSLYKGSYIHSHPQEFGIQNFEETPMDLVIRRYSGKTVLPPYEGIRLSLMLWDKYDVTGLSYPFLNHTAEEIEALLNGIPSERRGEVADYIKSSSKKELYEYTKIFKIAFNAS
jgi:radical SAM superfamily enzyme YgiQ (UPF0313 family)